MLDVEWRVALGVVVVGQTSAFMTVWFCRGMLASVLMKLKIKKKYRNEYTIDKETPRYGFNIWISAIGSRNESPVRLYLRRNRPLYRGLPRRRLAGNDRPILGKIEKTNSKASPLRFLTPQLKTPLGASSSQWHLVLFFH